MQKGRGYPQVLHRWKYPDCNPRTWAPRQLYLGACVYDQIARATCFFCGSDPFDEDRSTLVQTYTYPPLTYRGQTIVVSAKLDGTNDQEQRGFYVYLDESMGGWERLFCSGPPFTYRSCDVQGYENVSNTWAFGTGFKVRLGRILEVDWYNYPDQGGWQPEPRERSRDRPGRNLQTRQQDVRLGS